MSATGRPAATSAPESALAQRLVDLTRTLRQQGIPAGTSEIADAGRVAAVLGLQDRELLREGLASALVRRVGQRPVFDEAFDLYFPAAIGERTSPGDGDPLASDDPREAANALRDQLAAALAARDQQALERIAAQALDRLGRLEHQPGFSSSQALDALAPQTAIANAAQQAATRSGDGGSGASGAGGTGGSGGGATGTGLGDGPLRDELRREVAAFRRRVEAEGRRRNAEVRSRERIARYALASTQEQLDFTGPGGAELARMRSVVDPLAKKLAARLSARQRQASRGSIDLRATLRRSLATGGVPLDPVTAHRRPHRPDLVMLCDISGSVAGFSGFTMALMQALSAHFRKLRVFAFVSTTAEITDLVREADRLPQDVVTTALRTRGVLGWGASSSYGQALDSFVAQHLDAIAPRSTVLILGDARSNYGLPRLPALRAVRDQARRTAWLNPEPAASWGTGDSLALQYAQVVDMHECRNIEHLRRFVERTMSV